MTPQIQPQARYILPSFIEHSSWGVKESNPYNKLFEERIIFLGVQVDDASANDIMAQLLVLESLDPDRDITMYINSPGGGFTSLMAIYDTMQYVRADIQTVCLGQAASAAAVLLAAGTPGKRLALPNARVLIHQPSLSGVIQGQFSDLEIQAAEIERMRTLMETTLARHTGKDAAQIRKDTDRDKILTAEEAKDYGIIDTVLEYRKLSAQPPDLAARRTCTHGALSADFPPWMHARRTAAMSAGRTRQHPPTTRAPAETHCGTSWAENRDGPTQARREPSQRSPLLG